MRKWHSGMVVTCLLMMMILTKSYGKQLMSMLVYCIYIYEIWTSGVPVINDRPDILSHHRASQAKDCL